MLKILQDVTIRHDGLEIRCTAGQIVNVKASFDVNEERARGIEIRYADKARDFVKRVVVKPGAKVDVVTPATGPIHNEVEQKIRQEQEDREDDSKVEVIGGDDEPEEKKEEVPPEPAKKKGKDKTKKKG